MKKICCSEGCIHEVSYEKEGLCRDCYETKQRLAFLEQFYEKESSLREDGSWGKRGGSTIKMKRGRNG